MQAIIYQYFFNLHDFACNAEFNNSLQIVFNFPKCHEHFFQS